MKVTVFGASGKVGRLVVERLMQDGHQVTVFVHSSSRFVDDTPLKVATGDVHDAVTVAKALQGADAVISTLGSWHTPSKDILSSAMTNAIPVMQQAGIKRIVTLTGSGAAVPGEALSLSGKLSHRLFSLLAKKIIVDAETHLQLLQDSDLDWTCLRAPVMRGAKANDYTMNAVLPKAWELIDRSAVARALVEQLTSQNFIKQAPHIHQA